MDVETCKLFEAALRDLGASRLRIDQVVMVYQKTFPSEAMRPDMRERLHAAITELCNNGVLNIPEGNRNDVQSTVLPTIVEMSGGANFIRMSPDHLN